MTNYVIMFIVKTTMESDKIKKTIDTMKKIVTDGKGKIVETKEMGEKKLAYPIKKSACLRQTTQLIKSVSCCPDCGVKGRETAIENVATLKFDGVVLSSGSRANLPIKITLYLRIHLKILVKKLH